MGVSDWDRPLFLGYPAARSCCLHSPLPCPTAGPWASLSARSACGLQSYKPRLQNPASQQHRIAPACRVIQLKNELKIPFRFLQIPLKYNLSSVPFYYRGGGCLFHPHGLPPAPCPAPQRLLQLLLSNGQWMDSLDFTAKQWCVCSVQGITD